MEYLETVGFVIGLVYLYLQYKSSIWLWSVSIVMSSIYIVIFYNAKIYADMGLSMYYLVIAMYGWVLWISKRGNNGKKVLLITHVPLRVVLNLTCIFVIIYIIIYYVLSTFTDSTVPMCDSFTTSLSIVGMVMLARKYAEHWIVWIAVDIISAALYMYKDLEATALLYAIYTVVAVFGYLHWKKLILRI